MEVFTDRKERRVSYAILAIYLLLLIWLVLFKFAICIEDIPRLRSVNLIPFYYDKENMVHTREVIDNIIVFIPAGFYFSAVLAKKNRLLALFATFLISLLFEVLQWIFSIGASDITDLITNTIGGFGGMLLFWSMGKLVSKNRMKIVNVLGIIIELLSAFLIMVLTIANC